MTSITDYLEQYEKQKKAGLGQPAGKLNLTVPTTPAQNVGSEMLPQIPVLPQGQAGLAPAGQVAAPQPPAGVDPFAAQQAPPVADERSFMQKAGDFLGTTQLGENLGQYYGAQKYGTGISAEGEVTGRPRQQGTLLGDSLTLAATGLEAAGNYVVDPAIAATKALGAGAGSVAEYVSGADLFDGGPVTKEPAAEPAVGTPTFGLADPSSSTATGADPFSAPIVQPATPAVADPSQQIQLKDSGSSAAGLNDTQIALQERFGAPQISAIQSTGEGLGMRTDAQGRMVDPNVDRSSFDQASADRETRAAESFGQPRGPDSRDRDRRGTMSMEDATQLTGGNRDAANALLKRQELGLGEFKAEGGDNGMTFEQKLALRKQEFTEMESERKAKVTTEEAATEEIEGKTRDFAAAEAMFSSNQNIADVGNKAQRQAGEGLATGIAGAVLSKLKPGSSAADLQANLDTLEADAAFSALQTMRDNSKTGGALGAISERELTLLGAAQRSLAASQSPEQLKTNISAYLKLRAESMARVKAGFAKEYGPAEANRIFGGGSGEGSTGAIPNDRNVAGASDALLNSGKY
jgi:hypothetical protein